MRLDIAQGGVQYFLSALLPRLQTPLLYAADPPYTTILATWLLHEKWRKMAKKKLRVAFIGAGGIAGAHMRYPSDSAYAVSYTHLTLPTKRIV